MLSKPDNLQDDFCFRKHDNMIGKYKIGLIPWRKSLIPVRLTGRQTGKMGATHSHFPPALWDEKALMALLLTKR